jgi:hypothetical protein
MEGLRLAQPGLGALAVILGLMAGCTAPPSVPSTPPPAEPVVVEAKPATISGTEESSTMFDNFTAYVAAVDGEPVPAGREGWNTPLAIKSGPRRLTLAFVRGAFTAKADVQLMARPDAAYQVKFASDAQIFGKSSYCEFWIIDTATGEKALAPTRAPLAKVEQAK